MLRKQIIKMFRINRNSQCSKDQYKTDYYRKSSSAHQHSLVVPNSKKNYIEFDYNDESSDDDDDIKNSINRSSHIGLEDQYSGPDIGKIIENEVQDLITWQIRNPYGIADKDDEYLKMIKLMKYQVLNQLNQNLN